MTKGDYDNIMDRIGVLDTDPTLVLIDGLNLYQITKGLDLKIDYTKLRRYFKRNTSLVKMVYYTRVDRSKEENNIVAMLDWLQFNGYTVFQKPFKDSDSGPRVDTDVEMACELATVPFLMPHVKTVFLFSGDGSFVYPVDFIKKYGVRTFCVAKVQKAGSSMSFPVSSTLRKTVDEVIDIEELVNSADAKRIEEG